MASSRPSSSGGASTLRHCYHCGSPGRALRKCAGCSLVGYCSKECQKAAWPEHESQCRDAIDWQNGGKIYVEKPTGGKPGGFASAHAFTHAVDDFLNAHVWAFYTDARALVASNGGVEWLQSTTPKIVNIRLRASFVNPSSQWDRNPSTPFKFDSSSAITSTEYDRIARFGADLAGLIPVIITIDGVAFARFDFFPFRQPRGLPRNLKGKGKQILDDARTLCKEIINCGLPLRAVGTDQQCVYPGRFVHELKTWEWKPLFEDWAEYDARGRNEVINAALRKFTSGLFVANVILNVQRL